ncbi:hypothetical protein LX32DRAFT_247532 [Colletotrichum zoysiae]|uniref:Uncharacterized protein n=1 Tax=Colletotrichum zoysiae TaxID=1216348 RepID=A0AAD9HMK9_9PEZI|nr:hypothetical protein LX32DRAFT_247532 [Colletotrichum zoysiae]
MPLGRVDWLQYAATTPGPWLRVPVIWPRHRLSWALGGHGVIIGSPSLLDVSLPRRFPTPLSPCLSATPWSDRAFRAVWLTGCQWFPGKNLTCRAPIRCFTNAALSGRAEVSSSAANTGPASAPPRGASEPNPCPRSATACSPTEPRLEPVHCPSSRARDEGTRDGGMEGYEFVCLRSLFFPKPSIDSLLQSLRRALARIALNGRGIPRRGRHICTQAVAPCPLPSFPTRLVC